MRGGFEEVCDASEQQETALKTLESASTFASTLAFSRSSDINNTIVFTGVIASDSDAMPVFRLVCGTSVQKLLILKGIIELEAKVGIEPTDGAFAEPCLTTWLLRPRSAGTVGKPAGDVQALLAPLTCSQGDSN